MKQVPTIIQRKVSDGLHHQIITLLQTQYNFITGAKVQDMFARDLVDLVEQNYKDPFTITMGQVQWSGIPVEFKASYVSTTTEKDPIIAIEKDPPYQS